MINLELRLGDRFFIDVLVNPIAALARRSNVLGEDMEGTDAVAEGLITGLLNRLIMRQVKGILQSVAQIRDYKERSIPCRLDPNHLPDVPSAE